MPKLRSGGISKKVKPNPTKRSLTDRSNRFDSRPGKHTFGRAHRIERTVRQHNAETNPIPEPQTPI